MSSISDELRTFANVEVLNAIQISTLKHAADRIDSEMVELPRDRDGVPIRVGDTVYGDGGDGPEVVTCVGIVSTCHGWMVWAPVARCPDELTHILPDSWERIADELEVKTSSCGHQGFIVVSRDEVIQIADRIRKLAKREGEQ